MPPPPKRASLFDDDGADEAAGAPVTRAPALRVNKAFAERYEDKKRKQDLARARELGVFEDVPDSEDDVDEDEGEGLTAKLDRQIFDTINMIRNKDPRLYNPDTRLFSAGPSKEGEEEENDGTAVAATGSDTSAAAAAAAAATAIFDDVKRKKKPARKPLARDVLTAQLVAAAEAGKSDAFGDDDEDDVAGRKRFGDDGDRNPKVYDEEQAALRKAFLDTVNEQPRHRKRVQRDSDSVAAAATTATVAPPAAADDDDDADEGDDGMLLTLKPAASRKRNADDADDEGDGGLPEVDRDTLKTFLRKRGSAKGAIADHAGELADPEGFLAAFMRSRAWKEEEDGEMEDDEADAVEAAAASAAAAANTAAAAAAGATTTTNAAAAGRIPGVPDEEDEAHLEAADAYEARYNFRFEEPGGGEIVTYGRAVEGSVRRKDTKRKDERERKKDRVAETRREAEAETRRLVNVRRAELKAQMKRIRDIAGDGVDMDTLAAVFGNDLDADFDPAAHDAKMAALFGDEYYAEEERETVAPGAAAAAAASRGNGDDDGEEEEEEGGDAAVPDWVFGDGPRPAWAGPSAEQLAAAEDDDAEDELLGLPSSSSSSGGGGGARQGKQQQPRAGGNAALDDADGDAALEQQEGEGEGAEVEEEEAYDPAVSGHRRGAAGRRANKQQRRRMSALARARALTAHDDGDGDEGDMADPDSLLALGFEDVIAGGLRTRFKYTSVPAADYGLTEEDILLADDADLKNYVALRKLAPYRETEWVVPPKVRRRAVADIRRKLRAAHPTGFQSSATADAEGGSAVTSGAGGDEPEGGADDDERAVSSTAASAAGSSSSSSSSIAAADAEDGVNQQPQKPEQRKKKRKRLAAEAAAAAAATAALIHSSRADSTDDDDSDDDNAAAAPARLDTAASSTAAPVISSSARRRQRRKQQKQQGQAPQSNGVARGAAAVAGAVPARASIDAAKHTTEHTALPTTSSSSSAAAAAAAADVAATQASSAKLSVAHAASSSSSGSKHRDRPSKKAKKGEEIVSLPGGVSISKSRLAAYGPLISKK